MRRLLLAGGLAVAVLLAPLLAIPVMVITTVAGLPGQSGQVCASTPVSQAGSTAGSMTVDDLSAGQLTHVTTILQVGLDKGISEQGLVVALATAAQESKFRNYANDGTGSGLRADQRDVARSLSYPHDAVGRDHGSVNVFQQQYPWWGTLDELMHPPTAAGKFYDALLAVPGWETMAVAQAAQAVQRSAFPAAYAQWEPLARQLVTTLSPGLTSTPGVGNLAPGAMPADPGGLCGSPLAMSCAPTDLAAETGLTPDALRVLRCVAATFGETAFGGVAKRPDNPTSDHPAGRAVDVMITDWSTPAGNAHGWAIAEWLRANAAPLGITYVIWDDQQWSTRDPAAGWRPYEHPSGRSNPTLDHLDHVHVSVHGNAAGSGSGGAWASPLTAGTYRVSSTFGPRADPLGRGTRMHAGVDLAAPTGTPLRSMTAGTVTTAGDSGGYGQLVVIQATGTTEPMEIYYAHQCAGCLRVQVGDTVTAGQQIGAIGSTGNSTGPHLHLEVRVTGRAVDPTPVLAQYGLNLQGAP